jgi:hypothetical protein
VRIAARMRPPLHSRGRIPPLVRRLGSEDPERRAPVSGSSDTLVKVVMRNLGARKSVRWRVIGLARKDTVPESATKIFEDCDLNHSAGRGPMSTLGFARFRGERSVPWKNESRPCCAGLRKRSGDGSWNSRRSATASASGQQREGSRASSRVLLTAGPAGASAFHC